MASPQDRIYPSWHLNNHPAIVLDVVEFLPVGQVFQPLWQAGEAALDLASGVGVKQ